ncbi:MAG: type IV pilus biogenesis protein PilM [Candidatus Acidiferrales bacterium]
MATQRLQRWSQAPVEIRLVCEIAADYVAAVRYHGDTVEGWAVRPLPPGAVRPAPLTENIPDTTPVLQALKQAVDAVADGQRRCALLVPDLLARVAILDFDHWPAKPEEADGLLRWRLKKDLPFDVAQAVLSYQVQSGRGAYEVVAVACLQSLLRQYEQCAEILGLHPGWVTLSTLAAVGCLPSAGTVEGAPGQLLVKRDQNSLSLAILQGSAIRLFRSLPLAASASGGEQALFEKIYPAVVYFQDQWGEPIREVLLIGFDGVVMPLMQQFESEIASPARLFEAGAHVPSRGEGLDHRLAACLGWVQGEAR